MLDEILIALFCSAYVTRLLGILFIAYIGF